MVEYIDRNELIKNLKRFAPEHYSALVNNLIKKQPTADVVEVVRCEKCIHSEDYNGRILCNKNAHIFDKNDFCSYGTPKERGGEK